MRESWLLDLSDECRPSIAVAEMGRESDYYRIVGQML